MRQRRQVNNHSPKTQGEALLLLDRKPHPTRGIHPIILASYRTRTWREVHTKQRPSLSWESRIILCDSTSDAAHFLATEIANGTPLQKNIVFLDLELDSIEGCSWNPQHVATISTLAIEWEDYPRGSVILITIHNGNVRHFVAKES